MAVEQASRASCAAAIGTVAIETASTFRPVREAFWTSEQWRRLNLRYYPFFGRGYIQLTWESTYRAVGARLGLGLVGNPDLALDPKNGARIFADFWSQRPIAEAAERRDWRAVRWWVQGGDAGLDRLTAICERLLTPG